MKKITLKTVLLMAAALALPTSANASPPPTPSVVWTLNDFTFNDGATATGSFVWAPDTDLILSWDITMSSTFYAGSDSKNSPARYSNSLPYSSATNSSGFLKFTGNGGWDLFGFSFKVTPEDLDVASDHVALGVSQIQYESWNFLECNSGCSSRRSSADTTSAYLSSVSPIPEPETYALMLAGLAAVGAAVRRRRARA
jgi:hypothetical protein